MRFVKKVIPLFVIACLVSSCSTSKHTAASYPKQNFVDWEGRSANEDFPSWIEPALNNDLDNIPFPLSQRLKNKYFVVIESRRDRNGKTSEADLNLAKKSIESGYISCIARNLNAGIDAYTGGAVSGNEETKQLLLDAASNANFSGFKKVTESWVVTRTHDAKKDKNVDTYKVLQVYACDRKAWLNQAQSYVENACAQVSGDERLEDAAQHSKLIANIVLPSKSTIITSVDVK